MTLRRGDYRALLVSDLAARGIDVPEIDAVFNLELPTDEAARLLRISTRPTLNLLSSSVRLYEHSHLNSVSGFPGTLRSSKSRVYLLKDRDPVGLPASRSVGFSKWTVLIGRTGFDTITSVPDQTLNLR